MQEEASLLEYHDRVGRAQCRYCMRTWPFFMLKWDVYEIGTYARQGNSVLAANFIKCDYCKRYSIPDERLLDK